jgi:hypothetical protein
VLSREGFLVPLGELEDSAVKYFSKRRVLKLCNARIIREQDLCGDEGEHHTLVATGHSSHKRLPFLLIRAAGRIQFGSWTFMNSNLLADRKRSKGTLVAKNFPHSHLQPGHDLFKVSEGNSFVLLRSAKSLIVSP